MKKTFKKSLCTILLLCVVILVGCTNDSPQYTLTITIDPPDSGTVNPSSGTYPSETIVTLAPTPAEGYTFDHWEGPNSDQIIRADESWEINMTSNVEIIAVFFENNQNPIAMNDTANVMENDSVLIDVLENDTDPNNDTLTISSFSSPANGSVTAEENSLRYTPDTYFDGTDSFTYDITDGNGGTATGTVTITVANVNQPPVANDDTADAVENTNVLINVLENDTDPDYDILTISSFSSPTNGSVTEEENSLRYTPNNSFIGTDTFTYDITDGNGGIATGTVTISITMDTTINHSPIAHNDQEMLNENSAVLIHVLENDTDPDGDSLTITSFSSSEHGVVTQEEDYFQYTLYGNYYGTDSFTYEITDGKGGTASATVYLTINNINQVPVANDDTATVNENDTVLINVLENDSDPDGDILTIIAFSDPENGEVSQEENSLRYTPNENFFGEDTFTYDINDESGEIARAQVTVTVSNVNQPPRAYDDYVTVRGDDCGIINVLGNDTDPDNDLLSITTFNQGYYGGSVEKYVDNFSRVRLLYTPKADIDYEDEFTYTISDSNGESAEAVVFVTVESSNHDPIANDDHAEVYENEDVLINVIENDTDDPGDTMTLNTFSQPEHGTVSKEGEQIRYTPEADFYGQDSFTYTVIDTHSAVSNTATVSIDVKYKEIITINDTVLGGNSKTHNISIDQDQSITIEAYWDNGEYLDVFLLQNDQIINGMGDYTSPISFTHYLLSVNSYAVQVNAEYNGSNGAEYTLVLTFTL